MRELTGKIVADAINEGLRADIEMLKNKGKVPTLAVVRIGAREDDLAYERGLKKKFSEMNCNVTVMELPDEVCQEELEQTIAALNEDREIDGILLFRPLPRGLSEDSIKNLISRDKDVDCMGRLNQAAVFAGEDEGFAPCTAAAVMELLDFYGIELKGKKVTVVGRSLVIGKPVAMMLMKKNATVTICHTKTLMLETECKNADIIVACAGSAKMITSDYVKAGQIVIDVGMNVDENGKLCGDVDFAGVSEIVDAVTPVPRGVGSVTTSVLLKHTVRSAARL